ncbi:MAG: PGF-pre-PGF domain-containing protein [Methanolobus sp.]|nr:PGF-pre-PGF domain-containing protein [Methanolobus sp.]
MQKHKSRRLSNKTALLIIAITFICLIVGSLPTSAQTVVSIAPSSPTVETNQDFSVYVTIEPDTPFVGAQLDIDFDCSLMTANSVMERELFGGEQTLHIFNEGTIDNQAGTINGLYAALLGGTQIDESGVFVEVEFTSGDQAGYSDLGLSNLIVSNSEGQAIPFSIENGGITIIDPVDETGETSSGSSSGGGGAGGGAGSSEDVENIGLKEIKSVYVTSNADISYRFSEQGNPVNSISYHSLKTAGQITSTIEILKDTSATVTETPPGKVYRHINIWVGKYGYATEENIEEAVIGFSVPKEWLTGNDLDAGSIRMNRFSEGKWNELETSIVEENTGSVLFEAKTPGFSPFAITASENPEPGIQDNEALLSDEEIVVEENPESSDLQEEPTIAGETPEKAQGLGQNSALLLTISLISIAILRKK